MNEHEARKLLDPTNTIITDGSYEAERDRQVRGSMRAVDPYIVSLHSMLAFVSNGGGPSEGSYPVFYAAHGYCPILRCQLWSLVHGYGKLEVSYE